MPDAIFLTIATDCPEEAIADVLCCAMTNRPKWVRIVSDPNEIMKLPDGTKCFGTWYSSRKRMSAAELAWRDRRLAGGLDFLDDADQRRIAAWIERHKARMRGESVPVPDKAGPSADRGSVLPHPQPEIQHLVLSQRWT